MGTISRRVLASSVLLLAALGALLPFGPIVPNAPPEPDPDRYLYTLDRGGILRFNNGKVGVETAFNFNLEDGPIQVPYQVGGWQGIDFPLNLEAVASIMPELLINRAYHGGAGEQVALTVIGSNTSRKLHRPEVCYSAADWALSHLPIHTVAFPSGEIGVNRMLARNVTFGEERVILYWYLWRDGRRRIEDGAYVMQVASPVVAGNLDAATATSERFLRQIVREAVGAPQVALALPFGK